MPGHKKKQGSALVNQINKAKKRNKDDKPVCCCRPSGLH